MYESRIAPSGGLDDGFICRNNEEESRKYARKMREQCFSDGYWDLGTGNSLANYMLVGNYFTALEEGAKVTRCFEDNQIKGEKRSLYAKGYHRL